MLIENSMEIVVKTLKRRLHIHISY